MIAIITGATGDIGEEFVKNLLAETDQVWAVGRSENKLTSLKAKYGLFRPSPLQPNKYIRRS